MTALTALVFLAGPAIGTAQAATLTGKVIEPDTRAPVAGATVTVQGADVEAITDAGGNYELELEPGTYTLEVEAGEDYETSTVDDVEVSADQPATRAIELARGDGGTDAAEFGDYEVQAGFLEGSSASVLEDQRVSTGVIEAISADQMSAAGDGDAAEALQRVTGLTIEQDKFVVIRGSPERYTEFLFNGSRLPSPEPVRRIIPLDLFPTSALSSISVQKSYDAAYPGSFGAGLVNLNSAGIPEEPFAEVSVSTGGNSDSTFKDGRDYDGGGRDWLGDDDGTRSLPGVLSGGLGGDIRREGIESGAKKLSNTWELDDKTLPADTGFSISGGTVGDAFGADLGVRAQLGWSRKYRNSERVRRDFSLRGGNELVIGDEDLTEKRTDMDVGVGGLITAGLDWGDHSVTSNTLILRDTKKRSQVSRGVVGQSDDLEINRFLLDWNERELLGQQFVGEHDFDGIELDWRTLVAQASRDNPDRRQYDLKIQSNGETTLRDDSTTRLFSESEDDVTNLGLDLTFPVVRRDAFELDVVGGVDTYRQERVSDLQRLSYTTQRGDDGEFPDISQDPEDLFAPENIGDTIRVDDATQSTDRQEGEAEIDAVYIKTDFDWQETVSGSIGVRRESSDFEMRTERGGGFEGDPEIAGNFERYDTLPSVNVKWRFVEDMQFRASYSKTISRPLLNQISGAEYFDPETGEQFAGSTDVEPAEIDNFDLRWEWYPSPREAFSLGAFFKDYTNPIEQSFIAFAGSASQPRATNADSAEVFGIEASMRSDFTRITRAFGNSPAGRTTCTCRPT
ncbi:MAG: TonB-dependent receptor [Halofilum sp. (in: g-proteobacteria)]|nr:TonB-dependent receptor [Halofilum sp. (in: g-proteobacteria)]